MPQRISTSDWINWKKEAVKQRSLEIIQSGGTEKRIEKSDKNLHKLWDISKRNYLCITGVPGEKKKGAESLRNNG